MPPYRSVVRRLAIATCVGAAALLATGALALVALDRSSAGAWPFPPLTRVEHRHPIDHRGTLIVRGVEDRGWASEGFVWTASFEGPGDAGPVRVADWLGASDVTPDFYADAATIAFINPDRRQLHVRTADGVWHRHDLQLPGLRDEAARFTATGLSLHDVTRFQRDLQEDEANDRPTTDIQGYDPATRTLRARVLSSRRRRELTFTLAADGLGLPLQALRRVD